MVVKPGGASVPSFPPCWPLIRLWVVYTPAQFGGVAHSLPVRSGRGDLVKELVPDSATADNMRKITSPIQTVRFSVALSNLIRTVGMSSPYLPRYKPGSAKMHAGASLTAAEDNASTLHEHGFL